MTGVNDILAHDRLHWIALLGIVLAGFLVMMAACSGGTSPDTDGASIPKDKDRPPNVVVDLYQGGEQLGADSVSISDLEGTPLIINFWAGLCPPCRAEMPDFQEFHDANAGRVTLLGIDVGEFNGLGDRETAKALLTELDITYPAGSTDDDKVIPGYKVLTMPTTVFIDSGGQVFRTWNGVLDRETLAEVTDEMLQGERGEGSR